MQYFCVHERVSFCTEKLFEFMNSISFLFVISEAVKLKPSVIEVALKNKAALVRRVPRSRPEAPLQG